MKIRNAIRRSRANSEWYARNSEQDKNGQKLSFTKTTKRDKLLVPNKGEVNMKIIETTLNQNGLPVGKALVEHNGKFYLVSESRPFGKLETLIFPSDSEGKITEYIEVGGGTGITLQEVLANFESELF